MKITLRLGFSMNQPVTMRDRRRHSGIPQKDIDRMIIRLALMKITQQEDLNFFLTNGIPRCLATRWMERLSRIENPLFCAISLWVWRLFTDPDLTDAREIRL